MQKKIDKISRYLFKVFNNQQINIQRLYRSIDEKTILIDVRSHQEYREGHLKDAINIPLFEIEKNIYKLKDKKQKIILYCTSGHRSKQAKDKLEKLGYINVFSLKNGLEGM